MISKKHFIITLLVLVSGCNSDNDVSQNETDNGAIIRFGGKITNIISKAITDGDSFPESTNIGIFGWGHTNGNTTNQSLRKDLNNKQYTKVPGSNEFTNEAHAHYPINPDTLLNFYAYYPYTAAATTNPLSIPFELKEQGDIMWATPVINRDKTSSEEVVNLSFNHILSAITLKFKKADDIKEDMILQSISMKDYSPTIQLNVQDGKLTVPPSTSPYTLIENLNTAIILTEVAIVTNYLLYPIENPTFIVRMSDKDYEIKSTKAFEGGKKQTYSFTIQAKDITISGSINPWVDGGVSNETVYF